MHICEGVLANPATRVVLGLAAIWLSALPSARSASQAEADSREFFERQVRPLLADACYECHSGGAKRLEAGLRLDHLRGHLQGGDSGPAIVPGEPDESLLIEAVRYESFEMPPRGKLSADQVGVLERWVAAGAFWPDEGEPRGPSASDDFDLQARQAEHWAWQPIQPGLPPKVQDTAWPLNRIDAYILQRLETADLRPAAEADRRTLARRLSYDLIGLPPPPDELDAFLQDDSQDAVERLVDRLLDSPHFGEKWARHWMDLVRYAETHGHEFDYPIEQAWRYRDYLIRAFNADVPYDQLVTEHLAGDLLKTPRTHPEEGFNESVIGTGFWFLGEAVHAPTDVRGDQAIRIDNQIDVMTKTFLGLTVSCARCHDHKFDPISTEDYYALAGFLRSSRRQEALLDPHRRIEAAAGTLRARRRAGDQRLRQLLADLPSEGEFADWLRSQPDVSEAEATTDPLYAWHRLADAEDFAPVREQVLGELEDLQQRAQTSRGAVVSLADFAEGSLQGWTSTGQAFGASPTEPGQWDTSAGGVQCVVSGAAHSGLTSRRLQGVLRSPTFTITHPRIHYRLQARDVQIRLIIDGYFMDVFNGLLFRGMTLNGVNTEGETRWQTQAGDLGNHLGRSAHIEIIDPGDGYVALEEVCFADRDPPREPPSPWNFRALRDPRSTSRLGLAEVYRSLFVESLQSLRDGSATKDQVVLVNRWMTSRESIQHDPVMQELSDAMTVAEQDLPDPVRVLAITDGDGQDECVHIRGSHLNLGEPVPRRLLEAISGPDQAAIAAGSGRLELAERILAPSNPFPARVLVNRLWHHLFGRGIVPTVDDFGRMGQPPTHPELLDWLAADFVQHGWSLKHAIRRMVLSRTYRMSSHPSAADPRALQVDPTNAMLHRMRVRRLPAESLRDAILAVSGRLDRKLYGPSVPVHLTAFMEGRGRPQSGPLDGNGRRSVYLEVRRNFLSPMMLAFDTPSPFSTMGRRNASNVPAQSLILMNDPFVLDQARVWARRLLNEQPDVDQRLGLLFQSAWGRPAEPAQRAQAKRFLQSQSALHHVSPEDLRVWTDLCHVVFNTKAFLYLN